MKDSELKEIINNVYGLRKNHLTVGELLRSNDNWLSGTRVSIYAKDRLVTTDVLYNLFQTKYEYMFVDHFKDHIIYVIPEEFIYTDTDLRGSVIKLNDIYFFKNEDQCSFIGYRLQDVVEFLVDKKLPCEII